jgi:hypothetical protein
MVLQVKQLTKNIMVNSSRNVSLFLHQHSECEFMLRFKVILFVVNLDTVLAKVYGFLCFSILFFP